MLSSSPTGAGAGNWLTGFGNIGLPHLVNSQNLKKFKKMLYKLSIVNTYGVQINRLSVRISPSHAALSHRWLRNVGILNGWHVLLLSGAGTAVCILVFLTGSCFCFRICCVARELNITRYELREYVCCDVSPIAAGGRRGDD